MRTRSTGIIAAVTILFVPLAGSNIRAQGKTCALFISG
jgi:hypothetical protein